MPRVVDHEARREQVMLTAAKVIADRGMRGLSFRAMADEMGGSTTLITHYYATQKDLLDDFAVRLVKRWTDDLKEQAAREDDPYERLMSLLEWLLPLNEQGLMEERCRINLLADQLVTAEHKRIFDAWERLIRRFLREHVRELVPEDRVEDTVLSLRALTNGISLSAVEHPSAWKRAQQLRVAQGVVAGLGIAPSS